jgi:hypothetical protein
LFFEKKRFLSCSSRQLKLLLPGNMIIPGKTYVLNLLAITIILELFLYRLATYY